jgi:hypothetical protein
MYDWKVASRSLRENSIFDTLKTRMGLKEFNAFLDKKVEFVQFDIVSFLTSRPNPTSEINLKFSKNSKQRSQSSSTQSSLTTSTTSPTPFSSTSQFLSS